MLKITMNNLLKRPKSKHIFAFCVTILVFFIISTKSVEADCTSPVHVSGTISSNTTWTEECYIIDNNVVINPGSTLTIDPSITADPTITIIFSGYYNISGTGLLDVLGTSGHEVIFTADTVSCEKGSWAGLQTGNLSTINYAVIECAEKGINSNNRAINVSNSIIQNNNYGVYIQNNSAALITSNTFENNTEGIHFKNSSTEYFTGHVNNNNFLNNGTYNISVENFTHSGYPSIVFDAKDNWWGSSDYEQIKLKIFDYGDEGSYYDNNHLATIDYTPFLDAPDGNSIGSNYVQGMILTDTWDTGTNRIVIDYCGIPNGQTLTINPGVEIKFNGSGPIGMKVNGTLNVFGADGNEVKFTSDTQNPGAWGDFVIQSSPDSSINHAIIEYAAHGLILFSSDVEITNSTFRSNSVSGLEINSSNALIQNNIFSLNPVGLRLLTTAGVSTINYNVITDNQIGIDFPNQQPNSNQVINYNSIYNNTEYNFQAFVGQGGTIFDATYNWWGPNLTDWNSIMNTINEYLDNSNLVAVNISRFLDAPPPEGIPIIDAEYVYSPIFGQVTWKKDKQPYIIKNNIDINHFATLTIEAGITLKFDGNYTIEAKRQNNNNATVLALGTQQDPIVFTSNQESPAKGDWNQILLRGSNSVFNYVTVEYADIGIFADDNSLALNFSNCTFRENNIGFQYNYRAEPNIDGGHFYNNTVGVKARCAWYGTCAANINNSELFDNGINLEVTTVSGDASEFTINAQNNWWGSSNIEDIFDSIVDVLDNPLLSQVDFSPYYDAAGPSGNLIDVTGIYGNISVNEHWILANSPYTIIGNTFVRDGATLTIDPGVVVYVNNGFSLNIQGSLIAQGLEGSEIHFQSSNLVDPHPGDWKEINFTNSGGNVIDYVDIAHAVTGVNIVSSGVTVSNSFFHHNSNFGILTNRSAIPIHDNTISFNSTGLRMFHSEDPLVEHNIIADNNYGIEIRGELGSLPNPAIHNNSILNNSTYNLYTSIEGVSFNHSHYLIDARSNYWGSDVTEDIALTIFDYFDSNYRPVVDFTPFLVNTPENTITITENSVIYRFFNPNVGEQAEIQYTIDLDADVTIKIYDSSTQELLRTLISNQSRLAGANSEIWDGKDENSNILPSGQYYYIIDVVNTVEGKSGRYDPQAFDGPAPTLENITITPSQASFDPFKGERLKIEYDLSAPALVSFGFAYLATYLDNQPRDVVGNVDYWDGRVTSAAYDYELGDIVYLPSDPFDVQARTEGLPENTIIIREKTTIDVPMIETNPYSIHPLYNEISEIKYSINEQADVTVSILSPDGSTTLLTLDEGLKTAGTYTLQWNGKTENGDVVAADGDYRVRVQMIDGNGIAFIRDGVIKVQK